MSPPVAYLGAKPPLGGGSAIPRSARTRTIEFHVAVAPETLSRGGLSFEHLILAVGERQDRSAFGALFAHFAPRVKAYLARTGSDSATADELTQEVMLLVWRNAARFDPARATASTWIFTIARNKRIDRFRRERHAEIDFTDPIFEPEAESPPDRRLETAEEASRIAAAVASLPEEQATLLRMAFHDGKSHSVIAAEIGLPLGTVKSRLRLALGRLRNRLGAAAE
jgi:RNA polymerase sigma-70 factor (ECF subfamily)